MREDKQASIFGDDEDDGLDWDGMPEFKHVDMRPHSSLVVHFDTEEDRADFAKLIGQQLNYTTRFVWHPQLTVVNYNKLIRYSVQWTEDALIDEDALLEGIIDYEGNPK